MKRRLLIVNSDAKESCYGGVAPFMRNMHPYLAEAFDVEYLYPTKMKHGSWLPNRLSTFLFFLRHKGEMKQYDFVLSHIPEASYILSFLSIPFGHIFHGNDNPMSVSRFKGAMWVSGIYDRIYRRIDQKATLRYTVGPAIHGRKKIFNPIIKTTAPKANEERQGFVFAGRLEAMKNIDRLIEIYAFLPQEIKEKHPFYIAGSGTTEKALKEKVHQMNLEDKVHFIGNIPNEKMQDFDSQRKVLLMASTREGMPTAIAEALTMGLPVVSTDVGDIKLVIKNGENGYLLPVDFQDGEYIEAICKVLNNYGPMADVAQKSSAVFDARQVTQGVIDDINREINGYGWGT